ncbi:L,D-transpeptidase family protein [Methylomagnum sp.]
MKYQIKGLSLLAATALLASCASDQGQKTGGTASAKAARNHVAKVRPQPGYLIPHEPLPALGQRTVEDVLYSYAPYVVDQLKPLFDKVGVSYPPKELTLVGLKEEKKLEVWARGERGGFRFVRAYDIRAASGKQGPKLRQGDRQVPEGVYRVVRLNPNSNYHLSMKLDYPNDFDLLHANREGRDQPGNDIFIHGDSVSAGCLAMGDLAIEELFVLAAHVGKENMKVVIAPHDPRKRPLDPKQPGLPSWAGELYAAVADEIMALPSPAPVKVSSSPSAPRGDRTVH